MIQNEEMSRNIDGSTDGTECVAADVNEIEKLVIQETVYYRLPIGKGRICPFDHSGLSGKVITVWNYKKEVPRHITVLECHKCGRYYLKDTAAENLKKAPLKIRREEIPYDVYQSKKGKRANGDTVKMPGQCRWPGCRDRAFKNGLCWDHLQHDNNVT